MSVSWINLFTPKLENQADVKDTHRRQYEHVHKFDVDVCVCVCESVLQLHSLNSLGRAVALRLCTSVWPFLLLSLCVTVLFIL